MFKYFAIHIVRVLLHVFYIFPINKKKILLSSFSGKRYFCNPKYIFIDLYEKKPELKYIWCLNQNELELPKDQNNIIIVKCYTLLWMYHILTSKVIITNVALWTFLPYRKNQIIINTWHGGGAYKKVGFADTSDRSKKFWHKKTYDKFRSLTSQSFSYFISSSKAFSRVMHDSYDIPYDKYLPIGMPRNDIFFKDNSELMRLLKNKLGISMDTSIVLYAPTHRGGMEYSLETMDKLIDNLDIEKLKKTLEEKFKKKYIFMFRGHPNYNNNLFCKNAIDISSYNDMQELLIITDVLITDYSSCVWDFSLTMKPCFLFVPDIDIYLLHDKGLYTSIYSWPYPVAKTNEELCSNIADFNQEECNARIKKHHEDLGSYEKGTATSQVTQLLLRVFD